MSMRSLKSKSGMGESEKKRCERRETGRVFVGVRK